MINTAPMDAVLQSGRFSAEVEIEGKHACQRNFGGLRTAWLTCRTAKEQVWPLCWGENRWLVGLNSSKFKWLKLVHVYQNKPKVWKLQNIRLLINIKLFLWRYSTSRLNAVATLTSLYLSAKKTLARVSEFDMCQILNRDTNSHLYIHTTTDPQTLSPPLQPASACCASADSHPRLAAK